VTLFLTQNPLSVPRTDASMCACHRLYPTISRISFFFLVVFVSIPSTVLQVTFLHLLCFVRQQEQPKQLVQNYCRTFSDFESDLSFASAFCCKRNHFNFSFVSLSERFDSTVFRVSCRFKGTRTSQRSDYQASQKIAKDKLAVCRRYVNDSKCVIYPSTHRRTLRH